ncbi:hypothetical protein K438DRAFT_1755439 [Mycena galopus ATCC 62051]|nr:hypothetical protein K438DRAFT_1755439 [Mycena galopus ATCC 62051]
MSDIHSFVPSSRASSPVSNRGFDSRPSSAMFVIEIHDSDSEPEETPPVVPHKPAPANSVIARGTETQKIRITQEEKVDQIVYSTTVPLSFDHPYTPTVILLDLLALNTSISSYEERTRSPGMDLAGIPKHNHPIHPLTKPTAEDKFKLGTAIKATGIHGLTGLREYSAPSISSIYGGKGVGESSPASLNTWKVRDFINAKKNENLNGLGFSGNSMDSTKQGVN